MAGVAVVNISIIKSTYAFFNQSAEENVWQREEKSLISYLLILLLQSMHNELLKALAIEMNSCSEV